MKNQFFLPLLIITCAACHDEDLQAPPSPLNIDYRQEMRDYVIGISQYSKALHPDFLVIPQNGIELVTDNGEEDGSPDSDYLTAIDGNGQEDMFYGYDNDDEATPSVESIYLMGLLDVSKNAGNTILTTDYCSTEAHMDDSYTQNESHGYISFAADQRELDNIPSYPISIHGENAEIITILGEAKNFLYLINPGEFTSKTAFIEAVTSTNYDLLIMDLFFTDGSVFSASEVEQLRSKANGGKRLVIAYMSIGEAENYRYYWNSEWNTNKPDWMDAENPDWAGNYKVRYWEPEWQSIIYGNDGSYLKKILDSNFDGVYLDIIDAFEYFENIGILNTRYIKSQKVSSGKTQVTST
ncbi:endo alpha-1,4 polygalactosaminidase [Fulvivirga ulvae]|uniref:endo alpha-1,4 polygalactosaminidase n=1 Tax=Fulvivirga ulvae TaxID=2904245 RepID=UPI001F2A74F9|nr:endo alpha-1,4 polygalactosaminidase [Fulvivirga ulvae]UII32649.1 endo alpha-1,4 polygalactosaminidase [Fulvivirga ulvae]